MKQHTPAQRSRIIRRIAQTGYWKGRLNGLTLELHKTDQLDINGHTVQWKCHFRRRLYSGQALNVFDALTDATHQVQQDQP